MITLTINNAAVDFTLENETTIGDVYTHVADWMREAHEYCYQLTIDGAQYAVQQRASWETKPLAHVQEIDFATFSPNMLTEYIPEINQVPLLLQNSNIQEAMSRIARLSSLLSIFLMVLPQINSKHQQEIAKKISALNVTLNELLNGIEINDTILMGDLLEYEVAPQIETLVNIVTQ